MALFGTQFLITIITLTVFHKIAKYYSLGRWLLTNLVYYVPPTDEELRKAAKMKPRSRNKNGTESTEPFNIPRNTEISLQSSAVKASDLPILHFFEEFEWLVNFSFCSVVVYALTELYLSVAQQKQDFNLSVIWLLLAIGFCLQNLFSMVKIYFQTDDGGERAIVVVFGFTFFVLSMVVVIINEKVLELGLSEAYSNLSNNSKTFLKVHGMEGGVSCISKMTFQTILSLLGSILGAFLAWPGIRFAKMHRDALLYRGDSPLSRLLLHLNLFAPLLLLFLWIKPAVRDVLVHGRFLRSKRSLLSDETFDILRIYVLLGVSVLRLLLMRPYLQSYLNLAHRRSQELRKEAGRILNTEYKKAIARIYYYMVVVALQYIIPVLLLTFLSCLYKTQGEFQWGLATLLGLPSSDRVDPLNSTTNTSAEEIDPSTAKAPPKTPTPFADPTGQDAVSESVAQWTFALTSLTSVFGAIFMRGVLAFAVWWTAFVMIVTSGFGVVYYDYFSSSMTGS